MTAALNLVVIRALDLERARLFYEAIGLRFTRERHGSGPEHLAAVAGNVIFEVYPATVETQTTNTRIGFSASMVDALVAALEKLGARVIQPPIDGPWGRRAVISDPDGHRVELTQGAV